MAWCIQPFTVMHGNFTNGVLWDNFVIFVSYFGVTKVVIKGVFSCFVWWMLNPTLRCC